MKKRIIPSILLNNGTNVFLSRNFQPWRSVGTLAQQLRLHVSRECDELLLINLTSSHNSCFQLSSRLLSLIRREVNVPISYVGGIDNSVSASECINSGFDKVYLTSAYIDNPSCIKEITSVIGVQSLGVCLPYTRLDNCSYPALWDFRSRSSLHTNLLDHITHLDKNGVGEILLYNVDRDGTMHGLDQLLLDDLASISINTPILMAGGAASSNDVTSILSSHLVQAIVAGSIFSLTENTPSTLRSECMASGLPMRIP